MRETSNGEEHAKFHVKEETMRPEKFVDQHGSQHERLVEGRQSWDGSVTEQKTKAGEAEKTLSQPFWKKRFQYFLIDKHQAQESIKTYKETVQGLAAIKAEAEKYMAEFQQDANDIAASRQGYEELQVELSQQLGTSPRIVKMSSYVGRVSDMTNHFMDYRPSKDAEKTGKAEMYKEAGKQAAVEDFFLQPNAESPHMKEPRMDIMTDLPQALERAKTMGAKNVLKVTIVPSTRYGVGEPQYKYVPVPENAADTVKGTVESGAMHGFIYPPKKERDGGNDTTVSFGYEMIPVNTVETELKPKLARVTFEVIGRGGSKTASEFEITDVNLRTLQQRVEGRLFTDHYSGLQRDKTVMTNAFVDLEGKKIPLEDFLKQAKE